jgi:hypothetical protein
VIRDLPIGLSYLAISTTLVFIVRRADANSPNMEQVIVNLAINARRNAGPRHAADFLAQFDHCASATIVSADPGNRVV